MRCMLPITIMTLAVSGCASDHDHSHTHDDLVSRTELQQLENEIGRLEFRLFELEIQGLRRSGIELRRPATAGR